jgi:3'-phosphoadenosine 5'-phosphosulfate sulfotransferase
LPECVYWGRRVAQKNPRVDAYELKINPNNESYFLAKSAGKFVQFEGITGNALQDGKLVMTKECSIHHVYDKPYAQASIIKEATSQTQAATFNLMPSMVSPMTLIINYICLLHY